MALSAAIMQPTYLPWIGYLAMIDRVDQFVYLDAVQFARRSWQQRNRIRAAHGEILLTIPVYSKGRRDQTIAETEIDWDGGFCDKHIRSIELAYRKTPHFGAYFDSLCTLLRSRKPHLADYTISIIDWMCGVFGIDTPRCRSSALDATGEKAELLASICAELGAQTYVSAPGSRDYIMESDAFQRAGVDVVYHEYDHPSYSQGRGDFLPYMSAIDLLFHKGGEEGLRLIRSGVLR